MVDALRCTLSASRSRRDLNRKLMSGFDGPLILSGHRNDDDDDDVGTPCIFQIGTNIHWAQGFLRMKLGEFGRMLEFCDASGDAIEKWAMSTFLRCSDNSDVKIFPSCHFFEIELLGHVLIFGVNSKRQANEWIDEISSSIASTRVVGFAKVGVQDVRQIFLEKVYVCVCVCVCFNSLHLTHSLNQSITPTHPGTFGLTENALF